MIFSKLIIYHRVLRIRRHSKQDLSVNIHGFTFFSYDEMEAWVLRMYEGVDQIEVWLDIIAQLSLFFNRASLFSACMATAICADLFFRKCQWTAEEVDTLLHPIKVHVKAVLAVPNHCEEALTLIRHKWSLDAEEYIRCQGLIERSLKLIASIAKRRDVPDLKTGLLLANTQAVRQIMEEKTFHSRRLFLMPQDWQMCKENSVPSRDLLDKELYNAGVHLNLVGEICVGRLLLPVSEPPMPAPTKNTTAPPTPAPPTPAPPTPAPPTPALPTPASPMSAPPTPAPTTPAPILAKSAPAARIATTPASTPTSPTSASSSKIVDSKKKMLDEWLHYCICCGLNVMWCEDVLDKPCKDLVGCLGVLESYFYTHLHICKTHRLLLAAYCHLRTDGVDNIHDCLQTLWTHGLSYDALMTFAKDYQD